MSYGSEKNVWCSPLFESTGFRANNIDANQDGNLESFVSRTPYTKDDSPEKDDALLKEEARPTRDS